jgi:hypothetical protein
MTRKANSKFGLREFVNAFIQQRVSQYLPAGRHAVANRDALIGNTFSNCGGLKSLSNASHFCCGKDKFLTWDLQSDAKPVWRNAPTPDLYSYDLNRAELAPRRRSK